MAPEQHPATLVIDILNMLFADLLHKDLSAAALVCRLWSIVAEDALWRRYQVPFSAVVARMPKTTSEEKQAVRWRYAHCALPPASRIKPFLTGVRS